MMMNIFCIAPQSFSRSLRRLGLRSHPPRLGVLLVIMLRKDTLRHPFKWPEVSSSADSLCLEKCLDHREGPEPGPVDLTVLPQGAVARRKIVNALTDMVKKDMSHIVLLQCALSEIDDQQQ